MILLLKLVVVLVLLLPFLLVTGLIWIFGGWRDGFDYMPNPVYGLLGWMEA